MVHEDGLRQAAQSDVLKSLERDIRIIRQDLIALLQETASVRASMKECSSWRPTISRRFIVVSGTLCFMIIAVLVVYQDQLRGWLHRLG